MLRKSLLSLISGFAVCGASQMAFAGDMPVKGRAPGGYDWSGFYVGATAGFARTKADVGLNVVNNDNADPLYRVGDIPFLNALGSSNMSASKAIVGGKIGYNHQWGAVVGGLEVDYSAFRLNKSAAPSGNPFLVPLFGAGTASFNTNVSTNWLATFRGRIGYSFDRALVYGTGGVALSRVNFSDTYSAFSPNGGGNDSESIAASKTKVGWGAWSRCRLCDDEELDRERRISTHRPRLNECIVRGVNRWIYPHRHLQFFDQADQRHRARRRRL